MIRGATWSTIGETTGRVTLTRQWDPGRPVGVFIGANPGLADENIDDATARKYVGFATRWGWGGFMAGNLFQWVATDMMELVDRLRRGQPVNASDPDRWLRNLPGDVIVCLAWGAGPGRRGTAVDRWRQRIREIGDAIGDRRSVAAGVNRDGSPVHLSRFGYVERPIIARVVMISLERPE